MTVSSKSGISGPYYPNGVTTTFPREFLILDASQVVAVIDGVEVTTGYSVTGVGAESGAVIFSAPPADGTTLYLKRTVALAQETDYTSQGTVNPEVIEDDFDRQMMISQDLAEVQGRALTVPYGSTGMEIEVGEDGQLLVWSAGRLISVSYGEAGSGFGEGTVVTGNINLVSDGTVGPYPLVADPHSPRLVILHVGGAPMRPFVDFDLVDDPSASSGKGIQFTSAPVVGALIVGTIFEPVEIDTIGDATIAEILTAPVIHDETDQTKEAKLDASLIPSGTQRVLKLPNEDGELATIADLLAVAQDMQDAVDAIPYAEGATIPTITFETAGDLSVNYTGSTVGIEYERIGNTVHVTVAIEDVVPTFTTAAGKLIIQNFPFPAASGILKRCKLPMVSKGFWLSFPEGSSDFGAEVQAGTTDAYISYQKAESEVIMHSIALASTAYTLPEIGDVVEGATSNHTATVLEVYDHPSGGNNHFIRLGSRSGAFTFNEDMEVGGTPLFRNGASDYIFNADTAYITVDDIVSGKLIGLYFSGVYKI